MDLSASDEEPWLGIYLGTFISYGLLIVLGHIRDFFGRLLLPHEYSHLLPHEVRFNRGFGLDDR